MILKWFWHNPHLVLTSAALSWAGHAVAARLAVGEVSPLLLMQLRWLFCFLILLAIFWKEMAAHWPAVKQRWRYVALMGGFGLAGFTSLFSLGAQHTTAVNLGITQGAIPAFIAIGLLSERMHGFHVGALLMVLAGIALAEKHEVSALAG